MKILSSKQVRELDAYTISHTPIESIDLMERACRAFMSWFVGEYGTETSVGIVCGTGNNGGDGLGIARMLREHGYAVVCWIIKGSMPVTDDFSTNLERARLGGVTLFEVTEPHDGLVTECEVLIDGLFGSGLSRPAEGLYAWAIEEMNRTHCLRIAIDIPSGLMADAPSPGPIVRADYTLTFQLPKLAFLLPGSAEFVGEWVLADIGLLKDFIRGAASSFFFTRQKKICRILRPRHRFDHKGTYGHALLIAGSLGKMGAAVLASRATLRAGVGLLTVHVPSGGNVILQTAVPEAMVSLDRNEEIFSSPPALDNYAAIGIGPGLGRASETARAFEFVLKHYQKPIVVDADALNILSEHKDWLALLPEGSILTPHPKEFERLAGPVTDDFNRLENLRALAGKTRCVIVLKGAYTAVAAPDGNVYFNSTGNPGMATGGTGDVLTGIITALLAQRYAPLDAARLGVYLHGLAGDQAMIELGMQGMLASDVVTFLPAAFAKLMRK